MFYVVRQLMLAMKDAFADVITQRNAGNLLTASIRTLDRTPFEPPILTNGDRGSLWANHAPQLQALLEDPPENAVPQNILAGSRG